MKHETPEGALAATKLPGDWAKDGDPYDCTGFIGPMFNGSGGLPEWPMYSFERPAHILWNAIAKTLFEAGWNDQKIKQWLQSKDPRWALDQSLGDALAELGRMYAKNQILGH